MGNSCGTPSLVKDARDSKRSPSSTIATAAAAAEEDKTTRDGDIYGLNRGKSVISGHAARKASSQCAYMMPTLTAMMASNPDLKILDVGCGPGSITVDFAEMLQGNGRVVGYDLSGAVLETAKVRAEQKGVENVEFVKGDVYSLPFGNGTFDIVHAHQAVAHFREQVRAIKELIRVTKKGGVICMREGDLHTARFYPDYPLLEECFETIKKVHKGSGGATDAGRRLKGWTIKAGIPRRDVVATHSAWTYNTPEGRRDYGGHWPARCTQGVFAERAVELGVKRERLEQYALAWRQWTDDPDGLFAMMHGEVIARKT